MTGFIRRMSAALARTPARQGAARHRDNTETAIRDVVGWLDDLAANPADVRDAKAAIDRAMQVYGRVLAQMADVGCTCLGDRVVVIHGQGTYCRDDQTTRLAEALATVDGRYLGLEPLADATYEQMANTVLDTLRGDHP